MKKSLSIIWLLLIALFITSCEAKNNVDPVDPNQNQGNETEVIIAKPHQDYIYAKVVEKSDNYEDAEHNHLCTIKVNVITNYNDLLNDHTENSLYVDEKIKNSETVEIIISDVYNEYVNIDDEFIYHLDKMIHIVDKTDSSEKEAFDARSNDYAILPVSDGRVVFRISTQIAQASEPNYAMYEKMVLRYWYYSQRIDEFFIEYDSTKNIRDLTCYMLVSNDKLSHFELVLNALKNIESEHFYRFKYSERSQNGRGVKFIIEYLENIAMEVQDENN